MATAIAWAALLHHGGGPAGFFPALSMWNVMMVAMMLPSLLPWLVLFTPERAALFAGGYFVVWAVYCSAAAAAQTYARLAESALPPAAGGALLAIAGAYQLTPWKQACLRHCRSPAGYLLRHWRSGRFWAFRVGLSHGATCIGCCWALMALAFALGVMNAWWMAALTLVVVVEKTAPSGDVFGRWLGGALLVWGAVVLAGGG